MQITSGTKSVDVARDLGLTLVADKTFDCPAGRAGHVEWAVPAGLLEVELGARPDNQGGLRRELRVVSGPHAGRVVVWYSGSAHFQPCLRWA